MSRSGYSDDYDDDGMLAMYRGQVASAMRGKRGQRFFRDLIEALDAMPVKRLIADELAVLELPCDMVRWVFAAPGWGGPDDILPHWRIAHSKGIEWPHESGVCAIGSLGLRRGVDMSRLVPDDAEAVAATFDIAPQLAREVVWENDENSSVWLAAEHRSRPETPEERWTRMRAWAVANLKPEAAA